MAHHFFPARGCIDIATIATFRMQPIYESDGKS